MMRKALPAATKGGNSSDFPNYSSSPIRTRVDYCSKSAEAVVGFEKLRSRPIIIDYYNSNKAGAVVGFATCFSTIVFEVRMA